MAYDKGLFKVQRITGTSLLDVGMVLDQDPLDTDLDEADVEDVQVSTFTMTQGYTVGDAGEQSLDPASGTATFHEVTATTGNESQLMRGDYITATYGNIAISSVQTIWEGLVRQVDTQVETSSYASKRGEPNARTITYQLSSIELLLLSRTVRWDYLPQESAYDRLSRWVTVDTSTMADSHTAQLSALVDGDDSIGSKSLLEVIRDFSAATKLPVRLAPEIGPNTVQVFDDSIAWDDQPLVPQNGFETGEDWLSSFTYTNAVPSDLEVIKNDDRFMGFTPPLAIAAMGYVLPVLKLTETFGTEYQAQLELDAEGEGAPPLASGEVTAIVAPGKDPVVPVPQDRAPQWGLNVRDYGAKGDGITNDTFAIQKALDAAAKVAAHVDMPAGTYVVSSTLKVSGTTNVYGEGVGSTFIQQTNPDADGFVFSAHNDFPVNGGLYFMRITGPGSGTGRGAVIEALDDFQPAYGGTMDHVWVENFGSHGFHLEGVFMTRLVHLNSWTNGGKGFFLDGGTFAGDKNGGTVSTGTFETSTVMEACYANGNVDWGYDIRKQTYCSYVSCAADSNRAGGYQVYDCTGLTFASCGAESTEDPARKATGDAQPYGFKIGGSAALGTSGVSLTGCYVYNATKIAYWWTADVSTTLGTGRADGTMTGCRELTVDAVNDEFQYGLKMDAGTYVTLIGCNLPGAPASNSAKEMSIAAGAKPLFITPANAAGDAAGIFFSTTGPNIFPYTDAIQINARAASQVPLVVTQYGSPSNADLLRLQKGPGAHSVSFSTYDGGQIKFAPDESVKFTAKHQTTGRYYMGFDQPVSYPSFNNVTDLESAFPAASYYGCMALVNQGAPNYRMLLYSSNGSAWAPAYA